MLLLTVMRIQYHTTGGLSHAGSIFWPHVHRNTGERYMKCLGNNIGRRGFMHVGFLGGLGLTLSDYFRLQAQADQKFYESKEGPAKSVIFIFMPGGMCHQETFDPKPYAPIEYRGPMNILSPGSGRPRQHSGSPSRRPSSRPLAPSS